VTETFAERLTKASSAHVTNRAGTDLRMSLKGRNGIALLPFGKKGAFSVVPVYAEAPIALLRIPWKACRGRRNHVASRPSRGSSASPSR